MFYQLKNILFPNLLRTKWPALNVVETVRRIHLSQYWCKFEERRSVKTTRKKDEGTEGESQFAIDSLNLTREEMFPDDNLPNKLFSNVPFSQIPICNIQVSKNNTIISITDAKSGEVKLYRSSGVEGFKNTRKGTNIAAQATAITLGSNAISKGYSMLRVRIKGLGPGRMSALKGLQMAGLNIISITDNTPVSWNPPRPRKQRRL